MLQTGIREQHTAEDVRVTLNLNLNQTIRKLVLFCMSTCPPVLAGRSPCLKCDTCSKQGGERKAAWWR